MTTAFSVCYWVFIGATAVVLFVGAAFLWLLTLPFDPHRRLLHYYTCWWGLLFVRCIPGCRIVVEGREKIDPKTTYVMVANHQSLTDVMSLGAIGVPFKWVSK